MSENKKKFTKTNVKNNSGKKPAKKANDNAKSKTQSAKKYNKA